MDLKNCCRPVISDHANLLIGLFSMSTMMKEEASKLLYETPVSYVLGGHNESPVCQSGNVIINPDYDDEIEVTFP